MTILQVLNSEIAGEVYLLYLGDQALFNGTLPLPMYHLFHTLYALSR